MEAALKNLDHQIYRGEPLSKHAANVLQTFTKEQPSEPIDSFEEMSILLTKQKHLQDLSLPPPVPDQEIKRTNAVLALLEKLDSPAKSKLDKTYFEMESKWAQLGIYIDKQTLIYLQASLVQLAERSDIITVRLWGSFQTPYGGLYVAEADILFEERLKEPPVVGPYDLPAEVGVGCNRYVYFTTYSPFDPWKRLPDVRPSDIVNSKKIMWSLSGDLGAAVKSYVPFNVTEDVYIRALICRISSSTIVAPNGYIKEFVPEEEEEKNEPEGGEEEEDKKEKIVKPLKLVLDTEFEGVELDGVEWVHIRPFILPQGRETFKKQPKPPKPPKEPKKRRGRHKDEDAPEEGAPEGGEEGEKKEEGDGEKPEEGTEEGTTEETEKVEEEEEELPEEEETPEEEAPEEEQEPEEGPELFQSTENDEGFDEENPCWNSRTITSPIPEESFVITENLRWPGAFSLTDGKKSSSLYWGSGKKFVRDGFQPPAPPPLAKEYKRKMLEQIDPTLDKEREVEALKKPPKEEEEEDQHEEQAAQEDDEEQ